MRQFRQLAYPRTSPVAVTCLLACLMLQACEFSTNSDPSATSRFELKVASGTVTLSVGETAQLQVTPVDGAGQPYTGVYTVAWSSSNASVAQVTSAAQLTGVAMGSAVITAKATRVDTGATATAQVTITVASADAGTTADTSAPSAPTALSATATSASSISLTWSASSDNVAVTGYRIFSGTSQVGTSSTTSFAHTGLLPSTTYSYTVRAFDAAGNVSLDSASASATTQPVVAVSGLVAAYGFSQGSGSSLVDASGHAVTGTFVGASTWGVGKTGGGLVFTGTSANFVTMGDVATLDGLTRLTVSAWVKTTEAGEKHVVDKSSCDGAKNGGPFEFGVGFFTSGKATLLVAPANGAPANYLSVESATSVNDGAWHFIAGVYDGNALQMYVDGSLSGSTSAAGLTLAASSNSLELGGHCNGNAYPWNGAVDDVRLYSRALSAGEIVTDMNSAVVDPAGGGTGTGGGSGAGGGTGTGGGTWDAGSGASYALDFATATIENPLSAGGVWSSNTLGAGGNVAPNTQTNMVVDLASDGVTRIAMSTSTNATSAYDDSFAFVPGFAGDQYVEGVIYKEPGYNPNLNPTGNHELELILGCSSSAGSRTWNEFTMNAGGGSGIAYLTGGPGGWTILNTNTYLYGVDLVDGARVRATRVGNVLRLYLNDALWVEYDGNAAGGDPAMVARGSGIGIAGFERPGSTHNKFGFRRVKMGSL